jgi:ABC-type phosphate/phosphonate transport system substrate-binding protein
MNMLRANGDLFGTVCRFGAAVCLGLFAGWGVGAGEPVPPRAQGTPRSDGLVLLVMDPLAKELACECVRGFAQRNYGRLATVVSRKLGRPITVVFSDDLAGSLKEIGRPGDVVVVGKRSVIEQDSLACGWPAEPVCALTGQDNATTLTGLFVVRADDPASGPADLKGRRILFGSENAAEKYAAALDALRAAGVTPPGKIETRAGCSEAALDVVDIPDRPAPAAVISSYALPLLEGCGSIKKGDLKVIGRTTPVPFITVFVPRTMAADLRQRLKDELLKVGRTKAMRRALESKTGFVPIEKPSNPGKGTAANARDWPDWRGRDRDGRVPWLPVRLPDRAPLVWQQPAADGGLAGLAVAEGRMMVAERNLRDTGDVFRCLQAEDGQLLWCHSYAAPGRLDYGQSPRATPVIRDGRVFLLGALGDLHCVRLSDGKVLWKRHLVRDLKGQLPKWGYSATPLLVDDLLVVNPGGPGASIVALDSATGRTRWATPGGPAAYASFIAGSFGGQRQIVGYDQTSLGGWDPRDGRRLWTLEPPTGGDFNVPTPVNAGGRLVVATENNGTRLYGFAADGRIVPQPLGECADLSPDTATPVVSGGRLVGAHLELQALDLGTALAPVWRIADAAIGEHVSLFAGDRRVLAVTLGGDLLLVAADGSQPGPVSRLRLFDRAEVYSHPALVGTRLFVRAQGMLSCFDLAGETGMLQAGTGKPGE